MLRRLLVPSLAVFLVACGGGGGGERKPRASEPAVAAERPVAAPEEGFCEFTYPGPDRIRDGLHAYQAPLRQYFHRHGRPNRNKWALLMRHRDLVLGHYATHVAGSKVRIFRGRSLSTQDLLATRLNWAWPEPPGDAGAETDAEAGPIRYHLRARPYAYRSHEGYVDFAAKEIGGGLLDEGFVQEEIAILETTFLPWMATVRGGREAGVPFCPGVSLKNLDTRPAVLQVRRFLEVADSGRIYGGTQLAQADPFDAGRHLRLLDDPQDIYFLAMAAKHYQGSGARGRYSAEDIRATLLLATRGFTDLLLALHADGQPLVVHTGNWGTGAFRNSRRTIWAIQRVAMEAACQQFSRITGLAPRVDFYYEAFDVAGAADANQANRVFAKFPANLTLDEYGGLIHQQTVADPHWQVRKKKVRFAD